MRVVASLPQGKSIHVRRADTIDTGEVVTALAKTVAELTCGQNNTIRQELIEQLMREIMDYGLRRRVS